MMEGGRGGEEEEAAWNHTLVGESRSSKVLSRHTTCAPDITIFGAHDPIRYLIDYFAILYC